MNGGIVGYFNTYVPDIFPFKEFPQMNFLDFM